jgi:hypothetical protein
MIWFTVSRAKLKHTRVARSRPSLFLSEVVVLLRNIFKNRWLVQEKKLAILAISLVKPCLL